MPEPENNAEVVNNTRSSRKSCLFYQNRKYLLIIVKQEYIFSFPSAEHAVWFFCKSAFILIVVIHTAEWLWDIFPSVTFPLQGLIRFHKVKSFIIVLVAPFSKAKNQKGVAGVIAVIYHIFPSCIVTAAIYHISHGALREPKYSEMSWFMYALPVRYKTCVRAVF